MTSGQAQIRRELVIADSRTPDIADLLRSVTGASTDAARSAAGDDGHQRQRDLFVCRAGRGQLPGQGGCR